jgi:hypothetical protein
MATPLNLYATKVFSEQPLGLWALDDKADYVSFLDPLDQDLSLWASAGVTSVVDATDDQLFSIVPPGIPFPEVKANGIISSSTSGGLVEFTSPFQLQPSNINPDLETFSFGLYVYSFIKIINLRLGFRYKDPDSQEIFEVIKAAALSPTLSWAMVSESFRLPKDFEDLELIIEVYYEDDQLPYEFVINAITAGQWAEEFQLKSFGISLEDIPSSIDIPTTQGLRAQAYGLPSSSGYYVADNNALVAKNLGVPLIFGTRNSTFITPKENSPSLIVPAFGFLNRSGQFNKLTAEFWIRAESRATEPRRIFGPIKSSDGLYMDGPFLRLKIGEAIGSHYIREWGRPMLLDIRVSPTIATLIINGEEAFSISLNPNVYRFGPSSQGGLDRDWLGFYAYEDVPVIQIDCVGIYPYEVPAIMAKRRWVYGQAVEVPLDIKGADSSSSIFVDYPFSKYAKNYGFPYSSKWSRGVTENLVTEKDEIRPPSYSLPEIRFSDRDQKQWIQDLKEYQSSGEPRISLRPNESWEDVEGHLFFSSLNLLETQTKSFYGVFESKEFSQDPQTLFEITDSINSNTLRIYTQGNIAFPETSIILTKQDGNIVTISAVAHGLKTGSQVLVFGSERVSVGSYSVQVISDNEFSYVSDESKNISNGEDPDIKFIYDSTIYYSIFTKLSNGQTKEDIFYKATGQKPNQKFFVGIDIPRFVKSRGGKIASFLGTRQRLSVYVAGNQKFSETFSGDIHRVGFCTQRNLDKIKHLFNNEGIPVDYENVFDKFGPSFFDAGASYFENDLDENGNAISPPPAFWSLILDGGDPYDFSAITAEEHTASYTLLPKQNLDQFGLDIGVDSYWEDYVPLSYFAKKVPDGRGELSPEVTFLQFNIDYPEARIFQQGRYDTSNSLVRSYVSFQYLRSGANSITSNFRKTEGLDQTGVVRPRSDWMNTKYEVVDGSIIYPPEGIDLSNISINVYLEFVIRGINTNPVKIRSLQLSSQAYGHSPTRIGTKFGTELIPFARSGNYFNYKKAPALTIYKGSTPYLYNTSNSGIELRVPYSNKNLGGVSVPINKNFATFFKIGTMQMSLKYGQDLMPDIPVKIFELSHVDGSIGFYLSADSKNKKRGQIYAINEKTGRIQGNLVFFANGIPVKRPVLYPNSWIVLGISFPGFLNFSNFFGALRFTSPIMFNNISYFQTSKADDEERFGFRQWFAVRSQLGELVDWGFWAGKEIVGEELIDADGEKFDWQDVLFLSAVAREELDASNIYNIFTGTERIISETDTPLPVGSYQYSIYRNIRWSSRVVNPA